jgi:D-ribose pyranase
MKKTGVINKDLSEVIASMGHKDSLVVGDAGLPIPKNVRRIDLAVKPGLPGFVDVIEVIEKELCAETVIVAKEIDQENPTILKNIQRIFSASQLSYVTHEELKELTKNAVAVVRTGEFTPYANVILVSGVVF